ncbi:MAG: cobaltochelatase subunit CobN, partial [Alphaproteobacteria bacterium]|nr:cobaltochelatase subunit CobN [Alphaproteobacteria bacterium]
PPHGYLAFYAWLRTKFEADAIIQFGKHGNLEWLPGKALALSETCYPEIIHGAIPSIYPFIVNDPGEGTQAKRRTNSVIIDHLMPALTRAGNEGELGQLEMLVDEYFHARQTDPRRQKPLEAEILALIAQWGITSECGIAKDDDTATRLAKLDGYLCELKELQIRDGLHIFGQLATDESLHDLLVSLLRLPRGDAAHQASILRALARDFHLENSFDPLDLEALGKSWNRPLPDELEAVYDDPVRLHGDVRERLEIFAARLIAGTISAPGSHSAAVVQECRKTLLPLLQQSAQQETVQLLRALEGCYIPAGASGAPTRNRWDVLPTGRNFFSVDIRALPTQAAWHLGWKSAQQLLERHAQDHGDYPKTLTMSAWGTANMRTGGDDIAQALAFIGARPTWQQATGRVTGFEILPLDILGRPRIDVTIRISGFFRDAFPSQIALLDQAMRAISILDEPTALNPIAAHVSNETEELLAEGLSPTEAQERAATRIYGSMPEAYGAGLQALMDSGGWQNRGDLARTFLRWGGFRYGAHSNGEADFAGFKRRLHKTEIVSHNQDNREHDILDSDDYYQFQGGLTAAVAEISGVEPVVYHNDHSQPDSPKTRLLSEELARVVRARVTNPKWIKGMMRHGYKGASEMAASINYMFNYAATTNLVSHALFDAVARAYIDSPEVCTFLHEHNPDALHDIAEHLNEALTRALWQPYANHHAARVQEILQRKPKEKLES